MSSSYEKFSEVGMSLLSKVYGEEKGKVSFQEIMEMLPKEPSSLPCELPMSEKDVFLITYGDSLVKGNQSPMKNLNSLLMKYLKGFVTHVHILPFFPYTSDDGFSIADYFKVHSDMGTWKDVEDIGKDFKLAADLVLNHCSKSHQWFQSYLEEEEKFKNFFIHVEKDVDLSIIVRPRNLPLLTPFTTKSGKERNIWTTFSDDQVDLNFAEPKVLIEYLRVMQFFIEKGVRTIRLDAIAYIWKEVNHPSIHHPHVHHIVQIYRSILNEFYPDVLMLSETNVPHKENITYFGNLTNEAQMIYQFSLPPLTLHAFLREDVTFLRSWAKTIPSHKTCTYFNFLASHDGVGVTPTHDTLPVEEREFLVSSIPKKQGHVSYKKTKDGKIPYEMNINYRDAIVNHSEENERVKADHFLASQAVMMVVVGVPAIYIHSMLGSGNYHKGVEESGIFRRINREKLDIDQVLEELENPNSFRRMVVEGIRRMIKARQACPAFHPRAGQVVVEVENKKVFVVVRNNEETGDKVMCFVSTSSKEEDVVILDCEKLFGTIQEDILSGQKYEGVKVNEDGSVNVLIQRYGVVWLRLK